jgi:hypothetical protein
MGYLLAARLFKPDKYTDRRAARYWTAFSFPFWQTDLLSARDSLSLLGFGPAYPKIEKALLWFITQQKEDGGWMLPLLRSAKDQFSQLWMSLAVCRVFKRFSLQ